MRLKAIAAWVEDSGNDEKVIFPCEQLLHIGTSLGIEMVLGIPVKILKTSKSHFAIGSNPIESKALYYHYLDLPILRTSADLEYYQSRSVDFFLIVLHLSDHMIIGCHHPGCLTAEYTFVFIAIFSYLLCFTFLPVLKSVLPFVLVQFWYRISSVSSSVL